MNDNILYYWAINSYKSLPYLKLAIQSIRENAYYKNQPIVVYTENDDETADWIRSQSDITPIIEYNDVPVGIGGGVNKIVEFIGKDTIINLIHSDMYVSRNYDKPLLDLVSATEDPLVACAWRLEPNVWNQPTRMGTVMCPTDSSGFGVYYHDFDSKSFLEWAAGFVCGRVPDFRKVEGVSYMMRTKYFVENDKRFAPSSFEDHMQSVIMQLKGYNFVVTGKAMVWHFGARGSIFLGQHDKLTGRSQRQVECEQRNIRTWIELWGEAPSFDQNGFIVVTEGMKQRYLSDPKLYENLY